MRKWTPTSLYFLITGTVFALPYFLLCVRVLYLRLAHISGSTMELEIWGFPAGMIARGIVSPLPLSAAVEYETENVLLGLFGIVIWFLIGLLVAAILFLLYQALGTLAEKQSETK